MPEPNPEQRLVALRRRWELERTPTASVSLAEEYRRVGSYAEARSVLETCLKTFPQHLSALIALGRVRLEAGDAAGAAQTLEKVLARDPMQLVANKMLAEAYLALGRPGEAEQRLRIYALLNDRDPELAVLQRRLRQALTPEDRPTPPPAPFAVPSAARPAAPSDRGPLAARETPEELIFALPALETAPPDLARLAAAPVAGGEIFAGLGSASAVERYHQGWAGGDVFGNPNATSAPALGATVTLGDLYLRQGHSAEAEDIFAAVLERDPGNQPARQGWLAARAPAGTAGPADARSERLREYLERLQRARARDLGASDVR